MGSDSEPPLLLDVRDLSVEYVSRGSAPVRAVTGVNFQLHEGEVLGFVGESGCGKSTLMLSLLRILPPAGRIVSGEINFLGQDLLALDENGIAEVRWKRISMVFQGAMNALNPVRTVADQISEAIRQHIPYETTTQMDNRVKELLDLVGIAPHRKDDYPHQYSGGMRQRAMIAMALACNPQIVIADEPTTALDVMIQAQILELLQTLQQKLGLAVVLVTHDLGVVAEMCDTVLVMYGGVPAEYASVDAVFNHPSHPYTQELLRAFPDLSRPTDRLRSIPGSPPRLDPPPPGCRFAARCSQVFDRCRVEEPPLYKVGKRHGASCHLVETQREKAL
jgi:peptide/nickel transport system ATP-binding protein